MNPPSTPPAERGAHFLTLFCMGSLMAVYGLPRLVSEQLPFWPGGLTIWLLLVAPLLGCLPSVLRGRRTGFGVLALLALVYFALGIWTLMDPASRTLGMAEVGFALGLFFSSATFLRLQGRRLAAVDRESGRSDDLPEQDA